jgi:hypothetical protein
MKRLIGLLLLAAATTLVGCTGAGFQIATPDGFAELEDQDDYGYRATNAQGVVLAVRREDNAPHGDLSFWSGAVDAHLRRSGYKVVEAVQVETSMGVRGRQLRYAIEREGRTHAFWVTVFVTADEVITIEAGGDKDFFDKVEKPLARAIDSLGLS